MTDLFDDDLDDLEDLLSSAVLRAKRIQRQVSVRRTQRTATEVSQDYAERLAEKATFRRLLSDEALDGVRFRWLFKHWVATDRVTGIIDIRNIDQLRKFIDGKIEKESERG